MPQVNRSIDSQYFRALPNGLRVLSEEKRQIELSFSSEQPYERWFGVEILSHDESAVNLSRLTEVGALLFHHGRDMSLGSIPVGRIDSVTLDAENHRAKAVVTFDTDEKSDLIYQKVKSGSIRGVSVGYRIEAHEEVKANATSSNGRFAGPCVVATRWSPYEISIEPTPADDSVGIGRSADPFTNEGENKPMNAIISNPEGRASQPAPTPVPAAPPDLNQVRAEAAAAERTRVSEISAMCREFSIDPMEHIIAGHSIDEVRAVILESFKSGRPAPTPAPNAEVTVDEEDKFRAAARDGQLMRMGYRPEKPAEGASDFRGMTLRNLAANCLMRHEGAGNDAMRMEDDELLKSVLGFGGRSVAQPDSSFSSIINDTMGAVLSTGYNTANTTFQLWTGRGSNPNFKVSKRYRLSAAGEPVEIKQGGEFKADKVSDEGVDTKLGTYGKKFAFTREAFVNDDLGTIAKAILAQTRSFRRAINRQVYELLGKNAAYSLDKEKLFTLGHANLGAAGKLSVDTLGELYQLMSLQKDLSRKEQLNITPKYGLFPIAQIMEARKLLTSVADPDAKHSGVINPVQGIVTPIFDAELDKYSAKAFYTAADPNDVDTIEVGYYNGKEEPTLESKNSWDILGIDYRMFHDWYVALLDYRGLAANFGQ